MNAYTYSRVDALVDIDAARAALKSTLKKLAAYEDRVIDDDIPYGHLPMPEIQDLTGECMSLAG